MWTIERNMDLPLSLSKSIVYNQYKHPICIIRKSMNILSESNTMYFFCCTKEVNNCIIVHRTLCCWSWVLRVILITLDRDYVVCCDHSRDFWWLFLAFKSKRMGHVRKSSHFSHLFSFCLHSLSLLTVASYSFINIVLNYSDPQFWSVTRIYNAL